MYQSLKSLEEKEIKLGAGLSVTAEEFGTLCIARPERKGRAMLVIKINDEVLTFDLRKLEWVSSDEVLASVLNGMLPEEIGSPQMAFFTEGTEGAVLHYLQKIWPELKVVVFEPEPPPPDIPGIVY